MRINMVEGQATASSQGQSVVIPAGTRSRVPLGDDGLAAGVPSPPEPYEQIQVDVLPVTLLNDDIVIAPALAEEDIPSAIVGSAAVGQESLESTFDSDLEGWSIFQDGTPLEHVSEGDAAIVCSTDLGQGIYWYFLAPPQWVGDWSPYYGGSLAFGIRQEFLDSQSGDSDVVIETGQGNLIYNLPQNPGIELTPYTVSLTAETGWTLGGNPVSESDMLAALRAVTAFRIRGEYRSGADSACLDYAAVLLPGESSGGAANLPTPETAPVGEESLESTFDSDLEGWSIFQDGTPLEHTSEGDAAFVCSTDLETGIYWYFLAPSQWVGDWSNYYDGALTFAIRQSAVDSQTNESDVVIETGQGDLTFDTVGNPGLSFTRYLVPLNAEAGWMLAGDPVSEDEMRAALSSVTALRLRGEFRTGADSACLDYASVLLPGDTESGASGSSQTGSAASPDPNVALGVWQSDYGEITFGLTSSTYTNDSGRMFYEINGNVLSGFWVEGSSAQGCASEMDGSVYWGRIEFTFNDEFTEFTGLWSYCDAEPTAAWNGRFAP
jgi:hypothetical protein